MLDPFGLHSRVLCRDMIGVVLYIGPCHLGPGPYIGIEVGEKHEGFHDGEVCVGESEGGGGGRPWVEE